MQAAASFNHNSSSRATAQKCLLHSLDEDPTSVLPAKAVIELSEDIEHSAGDDEDKPGARDADELPTSTPACHDQSNLNPSQSSSTNSEFETQSSDNDATQAGPSSDTEPDPIPLSSAAAVVSPPMS